MEATREVSGFTGALRQRLEHSSPDAILAILAEQDVPEFGPEKGPEANFTRERLSSEEG